MYFSIKYGILTTIGGKTMWGDIAIAFLLAYSILSVFPCVAFWVFTQPFIYTTYQSLDFPGDPVLKTHKPMQRHGFDSQSRKIPHAVGQLSLWTASTDPTSLEPMYATGEDTATRNLCTTTKSNPCSPELEKAQSIKDPAQPKNQNPKNLSKSIGAILPIWV